MKPIDGDHLREVAQKSLADSQIGKTLLTIINTLIDAEPELKVPHGFWIEQPGKIPYCSECGEYSDDAECRDGNFCQKCGVIMDQNVFGYISDGDFTREIGNWKRQKSGAAFKWVCSVCNRYQCDEPVHFCPDCKSDMKLQTFTRKENVTKIG